MANAVPEFHLKIGSVEFNSKEGKHDVLELVVDNVSDGPDMFSARLTNHDNAWLDRTEIALGNEVTIVMGFLGEPLATVFKGEVTGWEPEYRGNQPAVLTVRGYSKLHRLCRGRKSRSFLDVKYSDIASKIAREAGLGTGGVEATTEVQPYVFQNNVTNLDFLRELADRVDYEVSLDLNNNLIFARPATTLDPVATLRWGQTARNDRSGSRADGEIKRFAARLSSAYQVGSVRVMGWDAKAKKEIVAQASAGDVYSRMGGAKVAPEASAVFGNNEVTEVRVPVFSQADANAQARAIMNELALGYVQAEVEVEGCNKVMPRRVICLDLGQNGKRFTGNYYIVRCRHIMRPDTSLPDAGYTTRAILRRSAAE